jgi:hypothetical protein
MLFFVSCGRNTDTTAIAEMPADLVIRDGRIRISRVFFCTYGPLFIGNALLLLLERDSRVDLLFRLVPRRVIWNNSAQTGSYPAMQISPRRGMDTAALMPLQASIPIAASLLLSARSVCN